MNDTKNKVTENTTEEGTRRGRGRGVNLALAHVNLRLPHEVLEFYQKYPHYTRKMREVLTKFIYIEEQKEGGGEQTTPTKNT